MVAIHPIHKKTAQLQTEFSWKRKYAHETHVHSSSDIDCSWPCIRAVRATPPQTNLLVVQLSDENEEASDDVVTKGLHYFRSSSLLAARLVLLPKLPMPAIAAPGRRSCAPPEPCAARAAARRACTCSPAHGAKRARRSGRAQRGVPPCGERFQRWRHCGSGVA